jgi:hypothetical protein
MSNLTKRDSDNFGNPIIPIARDKKLELIGKDPFGNGGGLQITSNPNQTKIRGYLHDSQGTQIKIELDI